METAWLCESIRVSALWRAPEDVSSLLDWKTVIGSEPEQRETQPRFGTVREVGPVWGGVAALEFRSSPGRADWVLTPVIPPDIQLPGIPNLGDVADTTQKFRNLIFEHFARAYAAPRFAFGLVALHQQPTKKASYLELAELLGNASLRLSAASDFMYQINRPRASKSVRGLTINRLSRWTSVGVQGLRLQITASPSTSPETSVSPASPGLHATRVELDINSSFERHDTISAELRGPLLDEFIELAGELLSSGDVP